MDKNLDNNRLTVRDRTYNLLTQATTYEAFSNDGFLGSTTDPTYFDSLESIHGQIHGMTGRNGHMAVVDYAAFDPVFWLHHCNCDRIFAMWQALNPQQYVIPKVNQAGTFATKPGTIENVDSPLQPFWKAEGVFWTAAEVRDTRTFNYTYPELMKWSTLTPEQKSTRLRTDINTMYGQTAAFAAISPELFSASAPSHPVAAMAPFKPTTTVAPTHRAPATSAPAPAPIVAMARPPMEKEVSAAPVPSVAAASTQSHPAAQPVQTTPHEAPLPAGTTSAPSTMAATAGQKMEAIAPTSVAGTASTITTKAVETATTVATAATGAAQKVAAAVPPSVSQPVVSGANTMAGMAQGAVQRVVAAAPPSVTSAANTGMEKFTGAAIAVAASLPPVHPAVHDMLPASVAAAVPRQEVHAAPHEAPDDVQITGLDHKDAQDGKKRYNEWLANITVEKYAAQKTFFVYIFLGDFSEDPSKWGEDANLVGTHVVFANNMNFSGCERCRDAAEAHKLVTGTIPLTGALGDRLGKHKVGGLESQEIVPYLKQNLHWRIQAQDEAVIERKDIPSLTVSVAHVSVVLPDNIANFPTWGASQKEAEVTKGRPGGAEEHD